MSHHPIAIIGAGLGGLTLASVLHAHGVEAAVFDLDSSPAARAQGGMLDIHEDSGQLALRAAGLHEEFRKRIMPGGEAVRVLDKDAVVRHAEDDDGAGGRPEIDRGVLRDLLLGALPGGTVRWGAKVTGARPWAAAATRSASPTALPSPPACWSGPTAPGRGSGRCCPPPNPRTRACPSSRRTCPTRTRVIR